MKAPKINAKQLKETLKTIALTALIAGIAGFAFGLNFEVANHRAIDSALQHLSAASIPASK